MRKISLKLKIIQRVGKSYLYGQERFYEEGKSKTRGIDEKNQKAEKNSGFRN